MPDAGGVDKTRMTDSPGHSEPPPSATPRKPVPAPTASTVASPYGPGNEPSLGSILPEGLQSRYHLTRILGQGGFANVFLAHDSVLDQEVAVKVLRLGLASQNDRDRFLMEARIGAKLRHPNIATVFDIVQTPDGLQMVMEFYPGGTLTERIRGKGPLHPREATDIIRQVAQALSYAHRHNVIHRDVKPANIFLAGEGMIKLGDFGIAAHTDHHEFTQTGVIIGTPLYMPPEQSADSRDVDPRTDIYALGLTLYHMLTGRPPRVVDLESIPETFRQLMRQATAPERAERLVSAEQFIAMLDQIQARGTSPVRSITVVSEATAVSSSSVPPAPVSPSAQTASSSSSPTFTPPPAPPAVPPPVTAVAAAGALAGGVAGAAAGQPSPGTRPAPARAVARTGGAVAPQAKPAPPVAPPPPVQRRRRVWWWVGGLALASTLGFGAYLGLNLDGGISGSSRPLATPAPTATVAPTPTPTPKPFQKRGDNKKKDRPFLNQIRNGRSDIKTPAPTPKKTPTPKPTATPAPAMSDRDRFALALNQYVMDNPGVHNSLQILQEGGRAPGVPPQMQRMAVMNAEAALYETAKRNPNDLMLNFIAGRVMANTDASKAAQYFKRAVAMDQKLQAPFHLTIENINNFLPNRGMGKGRR